MCRVLLISLLLGASTGAPSVQEPVHPVQPADHNQQAYPTFQQDDFSVSDLGQDDSDFVLTAGNSRDFPENLVDESGDYNYYNDEEYSEDPSEAKFLSLTKELGDVSELNLLNMNLPLGSLSSKASAVISLNDSVTNTLSTIGNLGLLIGGIYLLGNSISNSNKAKASARSDPGTATVPGSDWRKYLAKHPPKFTNVMETSSLTTFNKKMGLTYGKPKPGRQGRPTEKKPFNTKPAKKSFRPAKSKFVRKSNEKNIDVNQERHSMVQMEHHHKRPVQGPVNGQNDRQGTVGRPVANLRPRIPTIPTLRLRMPTVTLPNLRLNRPSFSNLRQNLRDMVPTLRPLNLPSAPVLRPLAPLTLRRPQQPGGNRRPPAGAAAAATRPAIPDSTSSRPAPLLASTAAAGPVSPAAPQSTSIRPTLGFEDSTFRNQANPILPEPIEFNSVFDSNADPFAEFRDEDFGDAASFRELLDSQFGDFQFNKIKRKDD